MTLDFSGRRASSRRRILRPGHAADSSTCNDHDPPIGTTDSMTIDAENHIVQLCAAGMAIEGDAPAALKLFEQAWTLRGNDYEASIAAHFVARHQPTPEDTLRWNALAVQHAEAAGDDRVNSLLASLYLNLGESHRDLGHMAEAEAAAGRARAALTHLPDGGYRDLMAGGIDRLHARLAAPTIAE